MRGLSKFAWSVRTLDAAYCWGAGRDLRLPYTRAGNWLSLNRSSICRSARYAIGFIPTLIRSASGGIFGLHSAIAGESTTARCGRLRYSALTLFLLKWSKRTSVADFPAGLNSELRLPAANSSSVFGKIIPPTYSTSTPSRILSALSRTVRVTSPAAKKTEWSCSANLTASKSGTTERYTSIPANGLRSFANNACSNVRGASTSSNSAFCFRSVSALTSRALEFSRAVAASARSPHQKDHAGKSNGRAAQRGGPAKCVKFIRGFKRNVGYQP